MDWQQPAEVQCPYCGEIFSVTVDTSVDAAEYVEDCSTCCRPVLFRVECEPGEIVRVFVERA